MTKYICLSLLGLLTILTHETISTAEDKTTGDHPIATELLACAGPDEGITRKKCCCPTTSGGTQAQCNKIITLLNDLIECGATAIADTGTIRAPGVYCLANDVTGDFTITADHVLFDLNGHTIFGRITVGDGTTALNDIIIRNGAIQDSSANAIFINGPAVNNPHQNITIENLVISNPVIDCMQITNATLVQIRNILANNPQPAGSGVAIIDSTFITIDNVQTYQGSLAMSLNNITQIEISNSTAYQCDSVGFGLGNVNFARLVGCVASNCSNGGFRINGGSGTIINCVAQGNTAIGISFNNAAGTWEALRCQALNNDTDGFSITGQTLIKECQSAYNGTSGSGNGFNILAATTGSIEGCSAIGNATKGFNDALGAGTAVNYVTNFAANNTGGDYSALPAAFTPAAVAAAISYWINATP